MNAHSNKAFYYHAHSSALGGTLRQPLQRVVSTQASASLASAGGFSSHRIGRFHVDGLISVKAAHVHVSGSEHGLEYRGDHGDVVPTRPSEDGGQSAAPASAAASHKETRSWRTMTTASIEGLNVLEVLTADRIVAQVSVDHPRDGSDSRITLLGSRFENLRVHGMLIEPQLNARMFGARRKASDAPHFVENKPLALQELIDAATEQHGKREKPHPSHKAYGRFTHVDPTEDRDKKGSALCSLVETVKGAEQPVESYSHMLHIPDFGNVFLGEMLIGHFSAQLTMLRVEMGCMADGDLSACSVFSNGRTMP